MVETIFSHEIFAQIILPFLLVFTLIFAILEKSKVLGENKSQINAIIALAVGLLLLVFDYPREIIIKTVPFLAVASVVILIFMVLYGFVGGTKEGGLPKGLKITAGIIIGIGLLIAVLWAAGVWSDVYNFFYSGKWAEVVWVNFVFVGIVVAAIAAVIASGKSKEE